MKFESHSFKPKSGKGWESFEESPGNDRVLVKMIETVVDLGKYKIGEGAAAEVSDITFGDSRFCIKIHTDFQIMSGKGDYEKVPEDYREFYARNSHRLKTEKPWRQDVVEEASIANLAHKDSGGVIVPRVYRIVKLNGDKSGEGYYVRHGIDAIVMDQIDGHNLEEVLNEPNLLPENFDIDHFFDEIKKFISLLNARGIHHRDLSIRNIMIQNKTGRPVVIDFGRSTRQALGDPNKEETAKGIISFRDDIEQLGFVKDEFVKGLNLTH